MDTEIVDIALENFTQQTGLKVKFTLKDNLHDTDGFLDIKQGGKVNRFYFEYKKEFKSHHLNPLIQIKKKHPQLLLIGYLISPKVKEELKKLGIGYIDGAGNAYLENGTFFILTEGNKINITHEENKSRAFTKAGLKVLFTILLQPELINATYRNIAEQADVSLDTINKTLGSLKQLGYLLKINEKKVKLTNKKELLDRWMTEYDGKLKPNLHIGNFRFLKEEDLKKWKQLPLNNKNTEWGGEAAGELLTNYLNALVLTLYTSEAKTELIKNYRLIPDNNGNIKVYKKFWNDNETKNNNIVPPILAYADLINTGDSRCIETANKILKERLEDGLK